MKSKIYQDDSSLIFLFQVYVHCDVICINILADHVLLLYTSQRLYALTSADTAIESVFWKVFSIVMMTSSSKESKYL